MRVHVRRSVFSDYRKRLVISQRAHLYQISNLKVEREKALEHKQRMSRMMEDKENFVSKITAARSFIYEVRKEKTFKKVT